MNITDIRQCAEYYRDNYLKTIYIIITYAGKSFILIGEKKNFAHLMGIQQNIYRSNGYSNANALFNDIINHNPINTSIIPTTISTTSKMYKKILNFQNSTDIFWKNLGPITINYNPSLSNSRLSNVDVLLTDISSGYMLGWVSNAKMPVNAYINLEKHCVCSWIDESSGAVQQKEKYMPGQDVELIRYVFALDENSHLLKKKEYTYNHNEKLIIMDSCERNNCNLLIDNMNETYYTQIATKNNIHCKINGIQY